MSWNRAFPPAIPLLRPDCLPSLTALLDPHRLPLRRNIYIDRPLSPRLIVSDVTPLRASTPFTNPKKARNIPRRIWETDSVDIADGASAGDPGRLKRRERRKGVADMKRQ